MSRSPSPSGDDTEVAHQLIREIIDTRRGATDDEVDRLLQYIARAPFNTQEVRVPAELRGVEYLGQGIGVTADSLTVHLMSRVLVDQQWQLGTTAADFMSDVRRSVLHPSARLALYRRRGGYIAAIISDNPVPVEKRGDRSLPLMFVVYAIERGSIISAYQASDENQIAIPGDALWLR